MPPVRPTPRRHRLVVGALLTIALASGAGCNAGKEAAPPADSPAISLDGASGGRPQADDSSATTVAPGGSAKASTVGDQVGATSAPLAEGDTTENSVKLHVAITSLKRGSGDMVTLKFDLSVGATPMYSSIAWGTFMLNTPYLIDPAGQKKYLVVTDDNGTCICSRTDIHNNETVSWYTTFPPLPDRVKSVSVVLPIFAPFENVPVS